MLTLAIQKAGRLSDKTIALLQECDIHFDNGGQTKLRTTAKNFPLQVLFLRDDDIPECVADQIADAGIIGENIYHEKGKNLVLSEKLGFARCRLSIALPKDKPFDTISDLNGLKIATSYPNILKKYLEEHHISSIIHEINGSVEVAPSIGLSDAIFDIVGTGSTLLSNGLREVKTVMESEAVLISDPDIPAEKAGLLTQLLFRIRSVKRAERFKYILLNAPSGAVDKISSILPGMKSPTVMPLATEGWCSIHSVIREDDFWQIIEQLKNAGAEGILVIPIEKMIL
jgi:ATP phosphoribosyltransferase